MWHAKRILSSQATGLLEIDLNLQLLSQLSFSRRICHGLSTGVSIHNDATADLVDNYVAFNRHAGVEVGREARARLCHNFICNGSSSGVTVAAKAQAWIESNTVKGE